MPKISPFKALRYNEDAVKDVSRVVAPPYDIVPRNFRMSSTGNTRII